MRRVIIGVVTGACVCVLALAVLGAIDGYSNPDGYPPGLFPALPRSVAGCLWALAYFGLLAAAAGAFVGGIVGGLATGVNRIASKIRGETNLESDTMAAWLRILFWGSIGACGAIVVLAVAAAIHGFVNGFGSQAPVRPNVPPGFEAGLLEAAAIVLYLWPWALLIGFAVGGLTGLLKSIAGSILHRRR
jgi:hypothetical protein